MYAVYHGPDGLRSIAERVHADTTALAADLAVAKLAPDHSSFFDTLTVAVPGEAAEVVERARRAGVHLRLVDAGRVGISVGEDTTAADLDAVREAFGIDHGSTDGTPHGDLGAYGDLAASARTTSYLTHPVFGTHHSETAMLRYLRALSDRDFALDRGMIPLGSCTMKLNATTEMEPVSLPGFADLHPFAPAADAQGYAHLIEELESWLAEVTGYDRVSIQPNAGSQGELAGLLAIRAFHVANGDTARDICLIPTSAHGTNPATAALIGFIVKPVPARDDGWVHVEDVKKLLGPDVAAIMLTNPNTCGLFENQVAEIAKAIHDAGAYFYCDGANFNAIVGKAKPGDLGVDAMHINLHKTFSTPHGGGGPGAGPVVQWASSAANL